MPGPLPILTWRWILRPFYLRSLNRRSSSMPTMSIMKRSQSPFQLLSSPKSQETPQIRSLQSILSRNLQLMNRQAERITFTNASSRTVGSRSPSDATCTITSASTSAWSRSHALTAVKLSPQEAIAMFIWRSVHARECSGNIRQQTHYQTEPSAYFAVRSKYEWSLLAWSNIGHS